MSNQTITTDATLVINVVNSILPVLETLIPQLGANQQLIGLSTSAVQALIPLINDIPTGGTVTVQQQAAQLARLYAIIAGTPLSGPEWQKQV